ncbi:cutinase-domain-containing protein [Aspergillus novoparasiticus]|uniref:Cutinase-domain-containing protein n=1 Tax=Aspergillus novoparasiticus TaxID=986946 RepID=A0A5N6E8R6_9EURO|nr:cutinase-domain-containing protein [Aspergillus novoparasiticus]
MHSLAQRIIADLGSDKADREAIDYPATGLGEYTAYMDSVRKGSEVIALQVANYANRCPTSKLVLLGYSQGAQIIGDAFCGTELTSASLGGSASGPSEGPISALYPGIILVYLLVSAIVLYGDPSFRAWEPYDKGTSTSGGVSYMQILFTVLQVFCSGTYYNIPDLHSVKTSRELSVLYYVDKILL